MKHFHIRSLSLLMICVLLLSPSAKAIDYCECPNSDVHDEKEAKYAMILEPYQTMGASIALIKDGRIIDTFQYGRADRTDNVPVDSDTYFRVASISKMVSAVGVMQLVEEGALSLDADLGDYFHFPIRNPYYPKTPVTLRQVMSHTATLQDTYHYKKATSPGGKTEMLRHVFDGNYTQYNFTKNEPGSVMAYSNFGGGLLGTLIEQMTSYTVDEYMNWKVFSPLNVGGGYHTTSLPYEAKIAKIYNGRTGSMTLDITERTDEHFDAEPELDYVHTAGALVMTAEGLAKIMIALAGDGSVYGYQLLQPETVEMMRTQQDNIESVTCDSGRGLNLNIIKNKLVRGRTLYGHQGKAYGMICAAYFDPTDQTGVVVLTNGCNTATVDTVAKVARSVILLAYDYL